MQALACHNATDAVGGPTLQRTSSYAIYPDRPRRRASLRAAYPQLPIVQAEPFGAHPALAALAHKRAVSAGAGPGDGVLLAAHGSPDPEANTPIHAVAALLAASGAFAAVEPCYLGLNQPDIASAIAAQVAAGRGQVVVVPYLFQLGGHAANDIPAAVATAQAMHPSAHIMLADPLGYDPLLADALLARAGKQPTACNTNDGLYSDRKWVWSGSTCFMPSASGSQKSELTKPISTYYNTAAGSR